MTIALVCGLSLTSCKDEEGGVANAVIVSTHSITFPIEDPAPVSIEVVSDGTWHCDAPEWITVTPSTGETGKTEVIISVPENKRDGAADLPRKFTLKFMGDKSLSAYDVLVSQAGDKYRDLAPISISDLDGLDEDAAAMLSGVTVYSATEKNIVVTDGTNLAYIKDLSASKGDKVEVSGSKFDADKLPYLKGEKIKVQGSGTIPALTATDITDNLDNYKSDKLTVIKVTGAFDGANVNVDGKNNSVQVVDCSKDFKMSDYTGHQIEVTGVYQGTAAPVVKLIATEVKDLGLNEVILFQDDFEWMGTETNLLTYESGGKKTSDNVGANMLSGAYNPQSTTLKTPDGESVWDLLLARGYNMYSTSESQAKKSVGCAKCYIKMAVTTYTAKLSLPKMAEAGDGMENVKLKFDWTPMTGGKAVWDQVEICVEVTTDGKTTVFPVDPVAKEDGFLDDGKTPKTPYEWVTVDMVLEGVKINKDTRISLRNADPNYPQTAVTGAKMRWFIDNIKVYKPRD